MRNRDDDEITNDDMRLVYTGAAGVLQEYALSPHFNWERDIDILRPIAQNIEKLMEILDRELTPPEVGVSPAD